MYIPEFLKPGDTIGIAATARSVSYEQLADAIAYMVTKGFKIHLDQDLYRSQHQYAGSDSARADYLNSLIGNPEVKAIWCARGGYGTARMIDMLDTELFNKNRKWIAGFSDVTVLHSHIQNKCQTATMHASMPVFMHNKTGRDMQDVQLAFDSLSAALYGQLPEFDLSGNEIVHPANFSAVLTGGNLSVLYSILCSESDTSWDGKILFLEDLDEYLYHVDRMLLGLKRANKLKHLKGILVGSFTSMHDNKIPFGKDVKSIILEHCSEYGYPIIFDIQAGHQLQNICLPLGMHAEFKDGILKFAAK